MNQTTYNITGFIANIVQILTPVGSFFGAVLAYSSHPVLFWICCFVLFGFAIKLIFGANIGKWFNRRRGKKYWKTHFYSKEMIVKLVDANISRDTFPILDHFVHGGGTIIIFTIGSGPVKYYIARQDVSGKIDVQNGIVESNMQEVENLSALEKNKILYSRQDSFSTVLCKIFNLPNTNNTEFDRQSLECWTAWMEFKRDCLKLPLGLRHAYMIGYKDCFKKFSK